MHDHAHPTAPWEEKSLPPGAIGSFTVRIFLYENEFIEEIINDRLGAAHSEINRYQQRMVDAQRNLEGFGNRVGEMIDGAKRAYYEWFFEPIQE